MIKKVFHIYDAQLIMFLKNSSPVSSLTSVMAFLSWTFPAPSSLIMFLAPSAIACSTR